VAAPNMPVVNATERTFIYFPPYYYIDK